MQDFFFIIPSAHAQQTTGSITNAPTFVEIFTNVMTFLLSIAGLVAIIGIVISGLLYLSAAGNEKNAQLAKKGLLFSIVGIAVVLGALLLVSQISNFFTAE